MHALLLLLALMSASAQDILSTSTTALPPVLDHSLGVTNLNAIPPAGLPLVTNSNLPLTNPIYPNFPGWGWPSYPGYPLPSGQPLSPIYPGYPGYKWGQNSNYWYPQSPIILPIVLPVQQPAAAPIVNPIYSHPLTNLNNFEPGMDMGLGGRAGPAGGLGLTFRRYPANTATHTALNTASNVYPASQHMSTMTGSRSIFPYSGTRNYYGGYPYQSGYQYPGYQGAYQNYPYQGYPYQGGYQSYPYQGSYPGYVYPTLGSTGLGTGTFVEPVISVASPIAQQ